MTPEPRPVPARVGRPRGSDEREVLDVARRLFTDHGFWGTTMDAVAAHAHVSKQSLYRDYPSKDELFCAVVRDWVRRGHDAITPHTAALAEATDVRTGLLVIAHVLQAGLLSTPVLQMRTLIAAEATRFPDVAADYVTHSWTHNIRSLGAALHTLAERGLLHLDSDPDLAAEQLTWLIVAAPLNRLTLQAGAHPYPDTDLATIADQAITTFLSRHQPSAASSGT